MKFSSLILFFFSITVLAMPVLAQPDSSKAGDSDSPNHLPMYGFVTKTVDQKKMDEAFIAEVVKISGSREKGSEAFVEKGWEAFFRKRDPVTAMMRFNQAWLLNPENAKAFWGFGVVSGAMGKLDDSVKFLTAASEKLGDDAKIRSDLGFSLMLQGLESKDSDFKMNTIKKALEEFKKAEKIDSKFEPLYSNWAAALFYSEDYAGAWEKVFAAQKLGGASLNPEFLKDLESRMPKPSDPLEKK